MKVALVHDYLREYGGGERVLEVLHEMFPDAPVYTSYFYPDKMPGHFSSWNIHTGFLQSLPFSRWLQKPLTYLVGMSFEQFDLRGYDLILSSSANFAKGILTHPGQIHISYCHTPTRFLWGLNTQTKRNRFVSFFTRYLDSWLRQWDRAAAERVDYFIANSRTTQKRIKRFYGRDSDVVYPPCGMRERGMLQLDDIRTVREKYSLPSEYFLTVSRLFRVKHIDVIVQAFNSLGIPLVVVGTGSEEAYLKSIAAPHVLFTGFIPDEDLNSIYAAARGFVCASEDEDFGMTVVEAQSHGLPIIALRKGGYEETIVENKTGVFFDTLSSESLVTATKKLLELDINPHDCIEQSRNFSTERFKESLQLFIASHVSS